ncbi:MAG: RelA/SpoT family protein [Flavobacteriaceae bacterium]|nr:RelA/SpoT family protein [Flavobacteriaceae bacterium]
MPYKINIEEENKEIAIRYKDLLKGAYQTLSDKDKKAIRKAFDFAVEAHSNQRRKTGEPYIYHSIAVAKIVAYEIGLGAVSIIAALLHDVVEDTKYTLDDIQQNFGDTVTKIVDGLTKISNLNQDIDTSVQAENFRKMLLTLNEDVRVILIKIADRYHNMLTMDAMAPHKQLKIASETLYIYAPLAHRLGLFNIKSELEDLGLKYTEPDVYNDIVNKIQESKEKQNEYIKSFTDIIKNSLENEGFEFTIKGRTKSIFSIRKKMLKQEVSFDEVYDKFAIRIIYKSKDKSEKFDAWKIYSIVTDHFQPNPARLRDWITQPKSTGYESLHTTVMGPKGHWVEVQIRSNRMDEIAEKGYAAHFKYKQVDSKETESGLEGWLNRLRESLENNESSAIDFLEDFKLNLYAKEIYVFTPNGDLKSLPKDSTALDFAFAIHTQVGFHCRGARVNRKLVPISYVLNSGDQVEIITSPNQKPNARWLDIAQTARARARIKSALKEDQKQIALDGKEILTRKLRHLRITLDENTLNELVNFFKLKTSFDLYYRAGVGSIENTMLKAFVAQKSNPIINFFKRKIKKPKISEHIDQEEISTKYDLLVFGNEEEHLDYSLAKCCSPIPGDKVFGFITVNEGIKIHRNDCPNAVSMQAKFVYRVIKAKWIDSTQEDFTAILKIFGNDNVGMVNNITRIISNNMNVNIQSINIEGHQGVFEGNVTVKVKNKTQLTKLIDSIKRIEGVEKVTRIYKH